MADNNINFTRAFAYANTIAFQVDQVVTATFAASLPKCTALVQLTHLHAATLETTLAAVAAEFLLDRASKTVNLVATLPVVVGEFSLSALATATFAVTLPRPTAVFQAQLIAIATVGVTLSAVAAALALTWDTNVWRGAVAATDALLAPAARALTSPQQLRLYPTAPLDTLRSLPLPTGAPVDALNSLTLVSARRQDAEQALLLRCGIPLQAGLQEALNVYRVLDTAPELPLTTGRPTRQGLTSALLVYQPQDLAWKASLQQGWALAASVNSPYHAKPLACNSMQVVSMPQGRFRSWFSWITVEPAAPPPVDLRSNDIDFLYAFEWTDNLEFVRVRRTKMIRWRTAYRMLHTITVTRVNGNNPIEIADLTLSTDTDSYGFRCAATVLGAASYTLLKELDYPEIEVRINTTVWRLVVLDIRADWRFGSHRYALTAVSHSVYLDEPFALARSGAFAEAYTLAQLADYEVQGTDFTLNWTAPDWLVPAHTWGYNNLTPIKALGQLVIPAGGMLSTAPAAATLSVKPKYKALPWLWPETINDIILPLSAVFSLSRELRRENNYNRIFVTGTTAAGIIGDVSITGTAGDVVMPEILGHALITDATAARAMGSAALITNLTKQIVKISTFFSEEVELINVGDLVKVIESPSTFWQGTVTDFELKVSFEQGLQVRQDLTLERFA